MPDHRDDNLKIDAQSVVQKIVNERREREHKEELIVEREEEWRNALHRILATDDGKLLAKYMVRATGLFRIDTTRDAAALLEARAKRNLWLHLFRKYLDPQVAAEIENQQ